jgi:hypothetical protein
LLALVKQGVLKQRKVCVDGKECNAYSKAWSKKPQSVSTARKSQFA